MVSTVKITGKQGLSDLSIPRALTIWETEVAPAVLTEIKRQAPVGQGQGAGTLRDSFSVQRSRLGGGITARFVSSAPYAKYVENGTAPHNIAPRNARALHWDNGGEDVFSPGVRHPGTKANPFVEKAIKAMEPMMRIALRTAVEKELRP